MTAKKEAKFSEFFSKKYNALEPTSTPIGNLVSVGICSPYWLQYGTGTKKKAKKRGEGT